MPGLFVLPFDAVLPRLTPRVTKAPGAACEPFLLDAGPLLARVGPGVCWPSSRPRSQTLS